MLAFLQARATTLLRAIQMAIEKSSIIQRWLFLVKALLIEEEAVRTTKATTRYNCDKRTIRRIACTQMVCKLCSTEKTICNTRLHKVETFRATTHMLPLLNMMQMQTDIKLRILTAVGIQIIWS